MHVLVCRSWQFVFLINELCSVSNYFVFNVQCLKMVTGQSALFPHSWCMCSMFQIPGQLFFEILCRKYLILFKSSLVSWCRHHSWVLVYIQFWWIRQTWFIHPISHLVGCFDFYSVWICFQLNSTVSCWVPFICCFLLLTSLLTVPPPWILNSPVGWHLFSSLELHKKSPIFYFPLSACTFSQLFHASDRELPTSMIFFLSDISNNGIFIEADTVNAAICKFTFNGWWYK